MESEINCDQKDICKVDGVGIKREADVQVKAESIECLVCVTRSNEAFDIYCTRTAASGSLLNSFLGKYTQTDLAAAEDVSHFICKTCLDLINVYEQAEQEYLKLKETFDAILSKNPLFEQAVPPPIALVPIKNEHRSTVEQLDSEDEPLARTKKKRNCKLVKKRKKSGSKTVTKQKVVDDSWECDECDVKDDHGGPIALAAHKITDHTITELTGIKTEDSADVDRSESPYNNHLENGLHDVFNDYDDDDNDSNFNPEQLKFTQPPQPKKIAKCRRKGKRKIGQKERERLREEKREERRKRKEWYPCDQCNARYSSQNRLEKHKQKHDGSKPPYICEVCGAHYKHKRACDIHIQLHKGISDWKCEECNKLFPSKSALQRHNNIHTGKLNYQCDLCGKSFIHTSSFKMHKLSHSGLKPHSCDVCGLALMTRSHLKRHKRIHSGEKRHECAVCGKRFSERYNLVAHAKSHDAAPDAAPPAPDARRRLFRCHFCPERFERRYMLERHVSAAHGRTLERPPATPRNTMSKLLKAQAQARRDPAPPSPAPPASPSPRAPPSKLLAHLTSSSSLIAPGSWSGAYAAEFGLRPDFPH